MSNGPHVVQVGIDHRSASLAVLEALHRSLRSAPPLDLHARCAGGVTLATCHRLELYAEGTSPQQGAELFRQWLGLAEEEFAAVGAHLTVRVGGDAADHLMSVAAGLESAVLGEDQIQGQVREAYREACARRGPGALLHRLFHATFRAGRRARSETSLKQGGRSLAGSGVAWLAREIGDLGAATVLVLGAGEMARVAAARLRERGVGRLLLANRTWAKAHHLAEQVGGEALPWAWRQRIVGEVDGIVCATGAPEPVIPADWLRRGGRADAGPLAVVDLAVPRNVEAPADDHQVVVADVEALSRRLAEDAERREHAVLAVRAIIEEELGAWMSWAQARELGVGGDEPAHSGNAAG